jgi:spermidine synthase
MTDLLGASAESNARVLGCFFLGLALGSASAALLLPKIRRPWLAAGHIQLGVALLCLPTLLLPQWTGWIWPALGPEQLVTWPGLLVKSVLSILVVLPPAFLLGMTLPLMTSAACRSSMNLASHGVWLYAANTLGGALGVVVLVGPALHILGARGSILLMIAINLVAAAACFLRASVWPEYADTPTQVPAQPSAIPGAQPLGLTLVVAFLSGLGILALEVFGLAILNLKTLLAFYTPAAVLFCVVSMLAGSAAAVPRLVHLLGGPGRALALSLAAAGLATAMTPVLFMSLTAGRSGIIIHGTGIVRSLLRLGGVTCLSLGPAVIAAGMVFPVLLSSSGPASGALAGRRLGQLLAVNGLGGVVGAETAYRLILPATGVHVGLGAVGAFYSLLSLAVLLVLRQKRPVQLAFSLAALTGTGLLLGTVLKGLPVFFRSATFNVLQVRAGREGSLAVVERPDFGRGMFVDNLYLLGSTKAAPDMERQAHLPLLLHPAPKRVGFVGLGTGITAGGALKHEAVESIVVVELSALVVDAAARHFHEFNQGLCHDPKVRVYVEDAGAYIAATRARFDVLVGDLFTPWRPGEARLCSLEQFIAAREALLPGGVFCQWLPMAQLTSEEFDTIAATFQRAFGQVHLFRNHFKTGSVPIMAVGFKGAKLDWDIVARRCHFERQQGRLLDPVCRHPQGLAMLYLGTYDSISNPRQCVNTLANLRVELDAGRQALAGHPTDYLHGSGELWLNFLRRQLARLANEQATPDSIRTLPEVGLLISQWEMAHEMADPSAPTLQRKLLAMIPTNILADTAADWSLWPGHQILDETHPSR